MVRYRQTNKYFYLVLVALVLLIFLYFNIFDIFFSYLVYPVQKNMVSAANSINRIIVNRKEIGELVKINNELKQKTNLLIADSARVKILEEENQILKDKLDFFEKKLPDRSWRISRIIGKSFDNQSILIIDKGEMHGLVENLPVVVGNGIMIGKIFEVEPGKSKVMLVTDSRSLVAGTVLNSEKTTSLVKGRFGLSLEIDLIPKNAEIKENDIVVTSGLEKNIPRGLIIGEIGEIRASPNDLFQSGIVLPSISYDNLSLVAVLLPDN